MALSGLAIAGIIIIIIGIIMAIIGIILLIVENTSTISWYVWFLVIGGILMGIIGGVLLAIALSEPTVIVPVARPLCPLPLQEPLIQQTCPRIRPIIQPVPQPTCPFVQPQVPLVPSAVYNQRIERLGEETFDPDPVTSVIDTPGTAVRRTVNGPYGPSGENMDITGVHKIPGQRTFVTRDIPEHPVTSALSNF